MKYIELKDFNAGDNIILAWRDDGYDKRYYPYNNEYPLPEYGQTGIIKIVGHITTSPNKEYCQKVEIDHKGRVLRLVDEPEIIDKIVNNSQINYDDIYKTLLT